MANDNAESKNKVEDLISRLLPEELNLYRLRAKTKVKNKDSIIPNQLEFKLATTAKEIEDALRLIQSNFSKRNKIKKAHTTELKLTKYNFLPTTIIFIAKWEEEVIGTSSLIIDSKLGIPMDGLCDLSYERNHNIRIAEFSSLSIKGPFECIKGVHILYYLMAAPLKYALESNIEKLFYITPQNRENIFKALFLSQTYVTNVLNYLHQQNTYTLYQFTDLTTFNKELKDKYKNIKNCESFYHLLFERSLKENHFHFEESIGKLENRTLYNKEIFQATFLKENNFLEEITIKDYNILQNIFINENSSSKVFDNVLQFKSPSKNLRKWPRASLYLSGIKLNPEKLSSITLKIKIWNCSMSGLEVSLENGRINVGDRFNIQVLFDQNKTTKLSVVCKRIVESPAPRYGLHILSSSDSWKEFINANIPPDNTKFISKK